MPRWTTKGDKLLGELTPAANKIPYFTGADTAGRLDFSTSTALGTSNTTIPSQNAVKAYVDALATGSSVLHSVTISGSPSAIAFTTGFTSGYIRHDIILHDIIGSTNANIILQGSNDGGATWLTTATNKLIQTSHTVGGAHGSSAFNNAADMQGPIQTNTAARKGVSGVFQIFGGSSATQVHYRLSGFNGAGDYMYTHGAASHLNVSALYSNWNAIRLLISSGTFAGGRITITGQLG